MVRKKLKMQILQLSFNITNQDGTGGKVHTWAPIDAACLPLFLASRLVKQYPFSPPHLHIPHNWHICQQYLGHIPWALWETMRSFIFFPSPHIPNTQTAVQPPQEILNEISVTQPPKSHPWSRRQSRRWPKLPGLPPWSPCPSSRKSHRKQLQPWSTAAWPWPCWWYAPGHCAPKSWVIRGFLDPRAMKHRTHTHTHYRQELDH